MDLSDLTPHPGIADAPHHGPVSRPHKAGRSHCHDRPHGRAQAKELSAAYLQMFRISSDLKALIMERNRALKAVRAAQRQAMRHLVLVAAQRESGGLEHCLRVGAISALLARMLGRSETWCDMLCEAAAAHDIGNLAIPDAILHKKGPLTAREWAVVRDHPIAGARLLDSAHNPIQQLAAQVALNHHEKWDGSGYPARRQGDNIPSAARIVAVADFVDSLALEAHGRNGVDEERIFALLRLASGAQFDPRVVRAMCKLRPRLAQIRALAAANRSAFPGEDEACSWWRQIDLPVRATVRSPEREARTAAAQRG